MIVRIRARVAACVLFAVAGGCAADTGVAPTATQTLDAALAEIAHPALDYAVAAFSGAGIVSLPIVPSRCPLDAATRSFVCAPLAGGGLTLNQRYTLADATGARQSAFDAKTTTSLTVNSAVAGTVARDATTLAVDGQQTLVITGLGSAQHTLNGSSLTLTTLVDPARVDHPPVKTTLTTTIANVVIPVVPSGQPQPWPISGTVDIRSLADYGETIPSGGTTTVSIATITFHGSSLVTLTVTVPGGIRTCQVNIAVSALGC